MKIGVDLDDVLLDYTNALFDWHNKIFGTNLARNDRNHPILDQLFGCDLDEAKKRTSDFEFTEENNKAQPVYGAQEALQQLARDHEIHIITSRQEECRENVVTWLEKYYKALYRDIHFANTYHGQGKKRKKSEICREIGIDIFIDDFIINAKDVAETGAKVFLFDTPWNQKEVSGTIERVNSWKEIVEKI